MLSLLEFADLPDNVHLKMIRGCSSDDICLVFPLPFMMFASYYNTHMLCFTGFHQSVLKCFDYETDTSFLDMCDVN